MLAFCSRGAVPQRLCVRSRGTVTSCDLEALLRIQELHTRTHARNIVDNVMLFEFVIRLLSGLWLNIPEKVKITFIVSVSSITCWSANIKAWRDTF